jgi:hypothetical protein
LSVLKGLKLSPTEKKIEEEMIAIVAQGKHFLDRIYTVLIVQSYGSSHKNAKNKSLNIVSTA